MLYDSITNGNCQKMDYFIMYTACHSHSGLHLTCATAQYQEDRACTNCSLPDCVFMPFICFKLDIEHVGKYYVRQHFLTKIIIMI